MSKWFELDVTVIKTYVVELEDDGCSQDAMDYVLNEFAGSDAEISSAVMLLTTDEEIREAKLRADEVCPL